MLNFIYLILGLCVLGAIVTIVYAFLVPTDNTHVCVEEKTPLQLESMDSEKAVFSFTVPVRNTSNQIAAVTDAFVRPYLPQEQFPNAYCTGNLERSNARRDDHYFEAYIMNPNTVATLVVTLTFTARNGKRIQDVLRHMVDMDACIYITGVGRKAHYVRKAFVTIYGDEVAKLVGGAYNG
jgi:hypothetical protein